MANVITGNVWELDTTGTVWTGRVKINEIYWTGYNGNPDTAVLKDTAGRVVFNGQAAVGSTDPIHTSYGQGQWVDGLQLTTLASGKVYVSIL